MSGTAHRPSLDIELEDPGDTLVAAFTEFGLA